MSLVILWSGLLAAGFAWVAVTDNGNVSDTRRLAFAGVALFLMLLASRTAFELVRRLVRR